MGKKRKSQPVVPIVKSRKKARKIVTQFHKFNDEMTLVEGDESKNPQEKQAHLQKLKGSLDAIGGRAAYQAASQLSVSFFSTSKWVIAQLNQMGLLSSASLSASQRTQPHEQQQEQEEEPPEPTPSSSSPPPSSSLLSSSPPPAAKEHKTKIKTNIDKHHHHPQQQEQQPSLLRLLEVGAINTTLLDHPSLQVTAIDLLSRHERIQQLDFFALDRTLRFDVVVASMVINSLPTARARGEFLKRCHAYLLSSDNGIKTVGGGKKGREGKEEDGEEKGDREEGGAGGARGARTGGGHLFLMLPLSCLTHSRRLSLERFRILLTQHYGFRLVHERRSPKVVFFVLQAGKDREGKGVGGGGRGKGGGKIEKSSSWAKDFDVEAV